MTSFDKAWAVVKEDTEKCGECGKTITEGYLDQGAGWFCSESCMLPNDDDKKEFHRLRVLAESGEDVDESGYPLNEVVPVWTTVR
jgi:hypothetical protein